MKRAERRIDTGRPGRRGLLICFVGNDGSGKSTLARATLEEMRGRGERWRYCWGGYTLILLWPAVMAFKKFGMSQSPQGDGYTVYHNKLQRLRKKKLLYGIYRSLMTVDHMFQLVVKVTLPLRLGRNILCDRYIYDTAVALASNYRMTFEEYDRIIRRYLLFCPKPDLVFYVHISDETAMQRKDDIPAMEYLSVRRRFYDRLAEQWNVVRIDGAGEIPTLLEQIRVRLEEELIEKRGGTP